MNKLLYRELEQSQIDWRDFYNSEKSKEKFLRDIKKIYEISKRKEKIMNIVNNIR